MTLWYENIFLTRKQKAIRIKKITFEKWTLPECFFKSVCQEIQLQK